MNTSKNATKNTSKNITKNTSSNPNKTALVTGATSGLGLEAARQLADAGYGRVIVTGRTEDKGAIAAEQLVHETGRAVFEGLAVDLNVPDSAADAAAQLAESGTVVDVLILNAGMVSGSQRTITDAGVETTISSSLTGDQQAAVESLMRGEIPRKFKPGDTYADAKVFVAHWAAALSRRLPDGMTVNAVSPGSAPDTNAIRNANFFMKRIMVPVFKHAPKRMGMAASTPVAAKRYIDASEFGADVTGEFFASAPKKMTGPIEKMDYLHISDRDLQEATWQATVVVSGDMELPITAGKVAIAAG